jgi:hypothetical protein
MHASKQHLLNDPKTLGLLFETLCLRDLLAYADALDAHLFHYRDNAGLEADALLQFDDGRWIALEIKMGPQQIDNAAATLLRLSRKMTDIGEAPPSLLVVIVGPGSFSHVRQDGVVVIPYDLLAP